MNTTKGRKVTFVNENEDMEEIPDEVYDNPVEVSDEDDLPLIVGDGIPWPSDEDESSVEMNGDGSGDVYGEDDGWY